MSWACPDTGSGRGEKPHQTGGGGKARGKKKKKTERTEKKRAGGWLGDRAVLKTTRLGGGGGGGGVGKGLDLNDLESRGDEPYPRGRVGQDPAARRQGTRGESGAAVR